MTAEDLRARSGREAGRTALASTAKREGAGDARTAGHKVDRRVLRSRQAIVDAFERLLADRPLDKITVSAIAQEANVDRKTFYQHFGSIDGLLDTLGEDMITRTLDKVEACEPELDTPQDRERAMGSFVAAVAQNLSHNLVRERSYFEHVPTDELYNHLISAFERQVTERGLLASVVPNRYVDCYLSFVFGGLFSAFRWWLTSDREMSIEETVQVANKLAEGGLSSIFDVSEGASAQAE